MISISHAELARLIETGLEHPLFREDLCYLELGEESHIAYGGPLGAALVGKFGNPKVALSKLADVVWYKIWETASLEDQEVQPLAPDFAPLLGISDELTLALNLAQFDGFSVKVIAEKLRAGYFLSQGVSY